MGDTNEEYKALTQHYFHEGTQMLKRNEFFVALNFGLFTIIGILSKTETPVSFIIARLLPIICFLGFLLSLTWVAMSWRARKYIVRRTCRMTELEEELEYQIIRGNTMDHNWLSRATSTTLLFMRVGIIFCALWVFLFWQQTFVSPSKAEATASAQHVHSNPVSVPIQPVCDASDKSKEISRGSERMKHTESEVPTR